MLAGEWGRRGGAGVQSPLESGCVGLESVSGERQSRSKCGCLSKTQRQSSRNQLLSLFPSNSVGDSVGVVVLYSALLHS